MRSFRVLSAVTALTLSLTGTGVQAQSTLQFQPTPPSPAVTAFGFYVGPFWGTVTSDPTRPTLDLFCVDVLNQITWGHTWSANFTNLASGNLSNTRHGNGSLPQYQQAAYLASLFGAPGVQTTQYGGIQTAIWDLLNPGFPNGGTNLAVNTTEAYWLAQAGAWYGSPGYQAFDFTKWTIVTDVSAKGNIAGLGTQEFLTSTSITTTSVTPEPETWMLMGTGLVLVVGFALKRGRMV